MPIETYYTTQVSTQRLSPVGGTDKETFQANIAKLFCRIEPWGEEPVMFDEAYFSLFKMWCEDVDIKIGDRVIEGTTTYVVKGVSEFKKVGTEVHHLEILLAKPI